MRNVIVAVVLGVLLLAVLLDSSDDPPAEPATTVTATDPDRQPGSVTTADALLPGSAIVTEADYPDGWPLTVTQGVLTCDEAAVDPPLHAVTFTASDGTVYAVNGTAKTLDYGEPVDAIWADAPDGGKVSLDRLIEDGLALCG